MQECGRFGASVNYLIPSRARISSIVVTSFDGRGLKPRSLKIISMQPVILAAARKSCRNNNTTEQ